MNHENVNFGRDQNINYGANQYIFNNIINSLPSEVKLLQSGRFIHYILVVLYLLATLVIWIFLGFFTIYEFPIGYVLKLTIACLQGSESFIETLKSDLKNEFSVSEADLRAQELKKTEYERLSKEESRLKINEKLLRYLYGSYGNKDESVSVILDEIEKREQIVEVDLELLKRKYDPNLYKLEEFIQSLLGEKDSVDSDVECIKRKLDDLVKRYKVKTEEASNDLVANLLLELEDFIKTNPDRISDSRLKIVNRTLDLLRWASSSKSDYLYPRLTKKHNSGWLEFLGTLVIIAFCVLSLPVLSDRLRDSPFWQNNFFTPNPLPQETHSSNEQFYWDQLNKAISVWDLQTAQESLEVLKQSQNPCISEFALGLSAAINNDGANGFQEVPLIKSRLNEEYNCNFEIPSSGKKMW
jgi:hypothetical protein